MEYNSFLENRRFFKRWNSKQKKERLAGPNGCGKSNILEVLAAIFFHLESQYLTFRPKVLTPQEFDEGFGEAFAGGRGIAAHRPQAFELNALMLCSL